MTRFVLKVRNAESHFYLQLLKGTGATGLEPLLLVTSPILDVISLFFFCCELFDKKKKKKILKYIF